MTEGNGRQYRARSIDPEVGILTGVGSEQEMDEGSYGHGDDLESPTTYAVWSRKPSADGAPKGDTTYFDRAAIKRPVWIWSVPAYFYAGATGGAAAVLGVVAENREELRDLAVYCRRISAAADMLGTAFLIEDLGRPERFLNMLRVFRPTSPMSIGSWVLAGSSGMSTVAAATARRKGLLGRLGRAAGVGAALLGMPLSGYTAVLLANTAVPAWQMARRTLPLLFMSSGVASAGSLLHLLPLNDEEAEVVRWFTAAGQVGELVAGIAVEREAGRVERAAEPYHEGLSGNLWKASKAATTASLVLVLLPGDNQVKRTLAGLLGSGGAIAVRFAVFHAGMRSSEDPRATFQQQRAGYGGAEATGTAAVTGAGGRRALDPEVTQQQRGLTRARG